jgi:uncharacterized protein (TIGR02594 family)
MAVKYTRDNLFDLAERFVGMKELAGAEDNPQILAFLKLDAAWPDHDEVPWCSGFVNYIAWLCRAPRSKSLRARSWLEVGQRIELEDAYPGDVVVLNRGGPMDPTIIAAKGHVGFYAGHDDELVEVLGGNQSNTVKVSRYKRAELLGVRRIAT